MTQGICIKQGTPKAMPTGPGPKQLCLALGPRDSPTLPTAAHRTVSMGGTSLGGLGAGRHDTWNHTREVQIVGDLWLHLHQSDPDPCRSALEASQGAFTSKDKEYSLVLMHSIGRRE